MKIAIIGATGTAGRATTRTARQAGYDVITLSRATGIDLHTGEGLTSALDGADVAIDTSNPFPVSADADLVATFRDATARVVRACQHAGVDRLVHLSICNIDDPAFDEFDYYLAKRAQEQVLADCASTWWCARRSGWSLPSTRARSPNLTIRCASRTGLSSLSPSTKLPGFWSKRPAAPSVTDRSPALNGYICLT